MTELELARRIDRGDKDAAEAFVREHHPAVLRLAYRLAGHLDDAEDIAQDTFVTARQKIQSFRGGSTLRTWLHSITVNQYRQWRRKRTHLPLMDHDRASDDAGIASFEAGHILTKAMQRLPENQREAFILFEVEQLSMNEVAQVLGIPVGTAKARVSYARQNLRTQLTARPEVKQDGYQHSASN